MTFYVVFHLVSVYVLVHVYLSQGALINQFSEGDPPKHAALTWDDFEGQNPETQMRPTISPLDEDAEVDWAHTEMTTEAPVDSDMIGLKTIIAIEFESDLFESVFLRGGYTGAPSFTCRGEGADNSCSIPIRHIIPDGEWGNYTFWTDGDNYLDMKGAEDKQGSRGGETPLGTPMRKMSADSALSRCNSDVSGKQTKTTRDRKRSTFWIVELEMDCSETYEFFEVKVVGKFNNAIWYEREIKGKSGYNRAVDESCVGGVGGEIPYISSSHVGFCGYANIFYYKDGYCEVNKIIDL